MADYIERKAAFNMMFSRANPYGGQEKVNPADIWNQSATIIRTIPSANVREDVQGEWIPSHEIHDVLHDDCVICGEMVFVGFKCSVCGRLERNKEPFCNCGARMTGGGER